MATILRKVPIYDHITTLHIQGQSYPVFPWQIIVWVSVGPKGIRELDSGTPRIPAVLDPAFTDNFLIHEQQLRRLAGIQPAFLRPLHQTLRAHGRRIPIHAANLWMHRNQSGERDQLAGVSPFFMELHRGIGICTDPDLYPRLPLVGARALRQSELRVCIDYHNCRVSVRSPGWFWFFWLGCLRLWSASFLPSLALRGHSVV